MTVSICPRRSPRNHRSLHPSRPPTFPRHNDPRSRILANSFAASNTSTPSQQYPPPCSALPSSTDAAADPPSSDSIHASQLSTQRSSSDVERTTKRSTQPPTGTLERASERETNPAARVTCSLLSWRASPHTCGKASHQREMIKAVESLHPAPRLLAWEGSAV